MDNYPEWQRLKSYQNHIKQLRMISRQGRQSRPKLQKPKSSKTVNKNQLSQTNKQSITQTPKPTQNSRLLIRYQTQPVLKKKNQFRSPIPLVSDMEGTLIRQTLNSKSISLKQKEKLLQNYLLSRRILQTKSVIKPQQLKRQFSLHKKISRNLSNKSRQKTNFYQQRTQSYLTFEREREQQNKIEVGQGRNHIDFKIVQILLIKRIIVKNPSVLYNMKIKLRSHVYQVRALTYNNLFHRNIRINFKKSILVSCPEIVIHLTVLRQNTELQIGTFKPVIKSFQCKPEEKQKRQVYKVMKGKFPVGTVELQGKVTYYSNIQI